MDNFNYQKFFNSVGIFSSLFEKYDNVLEVLPQIESFISRFKNNLPEGFREIQENVFVGENVTIDKFAKIEGSAIIGNNSSIGHVAYLRSGVLIGENVHVGHAVEIKHSIILDNTAIAHLNYVGDSLIGNNVNVGGGSILANWRFDKKNIIVEIENEKKDTGLEKFGAIISDGCGVGVNAVLNPGTILGKNSVVYPLKSISGFYPDNSIIKV